MKIAPVIEPYDPHVDWPEPDPRLVNNGLRPAPAFPLNVFGPLASYVRDLAAAKDGPTDYLACALLATAAGVVGLSRAVQLRRGWTEPCILWSLLVGNPSTGKSQPLDLLRRASRNLELGEGADFAKAERAWKTQTALAKEAEDGWREQVKQAAKKGAPPPMRPVEADAPPEPKRPRVVVGSMSVEKMTHLFAANPRGLFLAVDEGAAWFGNFGKYGGEGDAAFYLSAFNGIGVTIDRVKAGASVSPDRAYLSACVGIQPERLSQLLFKGRANDGLVCRFLPVWPDPVRPVWDTAYVDENRIDTILRRLRSLTPGADDEGRPCPVVRPLDPEAQTVFSEWWLDAKVRAQGASGLMADFLGKGLGVVARLAIVIELLVWAWGDGAEPDRVSARSVAAAIPLFEDYLAPMAARVYGDAARPAAERAAVALVKEIRARKVRRINAREVRRSWGVPGFSTVDDVEAAINAAVDGDCLRLVEESGKVGRKRLDYAVNPHLIEAAP
ncbi:MAG TPA: DUF3987 domain-containing protein [Caulobacteraceae bacterium]|nr:DUF3987 domain-containing protein [Caulobacteraceae bacterium]